MKPKYSLGAVVVFPLTVENEALGVKLVVPHPGLVIGVGYDPKVEGSIVYRVIPDGGEHFIHIAEDRIIVTPPDTRRAISRIRDIVRKHELSRERV
jgi:hypothetical protein